LVVEQGCEFGVVGKAPGGELRVQDLAVGDYLERRAGAGDELNLDTVIRYKQVPRTERTRLVVSNDAVFDADFLCGGHIP
jgi:hypothetical protein